MNSTTPLGSSNEIENARPQLSGIQQHSEIHRVARIGWLRAAILGANDGIVSTASLIVGVAASGADKSSILIAGIAGLASGAFAMAAGEYVSVSSQSDTEGADLSRESGELESSPLAEHEELAALYVARGLDAELAQRVASQLTARNAIEAHARDELGINWVMKARPVQAAITSALMFGLGALLPVLVAAISPGPSLIPAVVVSALVFLGGLGVLGARAGGAPMLRPVVRVVFWGAVALAVTAGVGAVLGTVI